MPFRIYLYTSFSGVETSILTKIFKAENPLEGKLFQSISTEPFTHIVNFVSTAEEADAILIPHNYFRIKNEKQYFSEASELASKLSIPLIIFTLNDETTPIDILNSIVLRPSMYRSKILSCERVIPALVEDVGIQFGYAPRQKESTVPSIGFSGMVQLASWQLELRYQLRLLFNRMQSFLGIISIAEYQGLYFRRKATSVIERSPLCIPLFNIRKTFSANIKTIEGNPDQMRREFVESIQNADLSLVVRGNGNYSLRFLRYSLLEESPFIDTDSPLPLEDIIDYDSFMIRVHHRDIDKIPEIVDVFWKKTTPQQYVEMQLKAREVFETYLRPDSYFKHFFAELVQKELRYYDMHKLSFIIQEIFKGKSILRSFLNYRLSQDVLIGKAIDIGGGKHPDYISFMKRLPNTELVSFDIKTGASTDFEKDTLPAEDASFDTVLFLNVMEHIFNYQHIADEVVRIVRPSGRLIGFVPFLMWYHPDHRDFFRYTHEALEQIFNNEGNKNLKVESVAHGPLTASLQMIGQLLPGFITATLFIPVYLLDMAYLKLRPQQNGRYALGYYFVLSK